MPGTFNNTDSRDDIINKEKKGDNPKTNSNIFRYTNKTYCKFLTRYTLSSTELSRQWRQTVKITVMGIFYRLLFRWCKISFFLFFLFSPRWTYRPVPLYMPPGFLLILLISWLVFCIQVQLCFSSYILPHLKRLSRIFRRRGHLTSFSERTWKKHLEAKVFFRWLYDSYNPIRGHVCLSQLDPILPFLHGFIIIVTPITW